MRSIKESEYEMACALRTWLSYSFPEAILRFDLSGVRLPIGLAVKVKRLNPDRAFPDVVLFEPRGPYNGMCIELKRSSDELYTKKGTVRKSKHLIEQQQTLTDLAARGFNASFAAGFEDAKNQISNYLKQAS